MRAGLGLVVLAAALAGVAPAQAAPPNGPTIELFVIQATRTDASGSVDPLLPDLPRLTKQQPFARFNVYKLLDRQRLPLLTGKPVSCALVTGGVLHVTLDGMTLPDAGEWRYRLVAQISKPGQDAFLKGLQVTASANQPFFVGGQSYQGGTLFVELVVRP